ncbi:ubiquinol oxidase 1a, mitochondrial [Corylus avellana]|nr:ubiquinol oxidase 1a, mitochondrial [Corylus avellana]XP_059463533.1 ubiquinol oxidase 1a, mitochondrial [Corylus avellana]
MDKLAYWTVKSLRWPTDLFFQRRYGCRAMMLETVAAVPGMVGGLLLHCKSLRRFEHSGGWIKALLEEAENERMHLMTFMEVSNPRWYERALVFTVQGVFFNAYFLGYMISPKFAHRVVGYLEEEAIHSYTEFLKELDKGTIENVPAPAIAIDYWQLPANSTLRDVVMVVRADEAHHRDVNHFASDIHYQGRELRESPAPVGYH